MNNLNKAIETFDEYYNNIVKDINIIVNDNTINIEISSINGLLAILGTSSEIMAPIKGVLSEISLRHDIPYDSHSYYLVIARDVLVELHKLLYPTESAVIYYDEYYSILESMNKVAKCIPSFLKYGTLTGINFYIVNIKKYLSELKELKIELEQVNSFITDTEALHNEVIYKHLNPAEAVSRINKRIKQLESDISEEIGKLGNAASQYKERFKYVVEW